MAEPLLPGDPKQLGAFYLDRRLGSGGQGVVYEGYGPSGDRVAVKVLHGVSDRDRDLFRKEAQAWRRVEPFCTAKVLHTDLDGPIPFVVSEYVAGRDLREAVTQDGPYGRQELRRLAIGVAIALVAIHRAGVVHRDLKPENILLGPDGPRVIDFGIARIEELPTTTGVVKGTFRYMPPERHQGKHGDAKVDVWGWGAVVLFAATGRPAFGGESLSEIQHQVATHEPDVSAIDEPLRSLVSAALAKDPIDRPGVEDLLLRLVAPGERAEDTLRSARRSEFADGRSGERILEQVLHDFTTAGILVWEDEVVTLAGAALIRAWPRLRAWVEGERDGLGVHQGVGAASRLWDDHGRKNSDLYQGTALERAQDWAATGRRHLTLNLIERTFLDAASVLARRRGHLRAVLSAVLAVLLVIAVGAAAVALDQRQTVIGQRDRAVSAQIAGLAMSQRRSNPELARRLAVAAARLADTSESWSALLALRHQQEDDAVKLPGFDATGTALDGTGRTLAAAAGTRVEFWDVETRKKIGSYTAPAEVHQVELSADGRTAAVSTDDGYTRMLVVSSARPHDAHAYPSVEQDTGEWPRTAVSPLGTYLLTEATNLKMKSTLTVWDTRTARKIITLTGSGPVFLLGSTSFSPDERVISLPGDQGKPFIWFDTRTKKETVQVIWSETARRVAALFDAGSEEAQ